MIVYQVELPAAPVAAKTGIDGWLERVLEEEMVVKSGRNMLKRGPNALKTARNRVSFGLNEAVFHRNHSRGKHMQKHPPPEVNKVIAAQELQPKTSADDCQSIQNINADNELRHQTKKGKHRWRMHKV